MKHPPSNPLGNPAKAETTITYTRKGKAGKVVLTARFPDDLTYTEMINVLEPTARERFADAVCRDRAGLDRANVLAHLECIAAEINDPDEMNGTGRTSQADLLVQIVLGVEDIRYETHTQEDQSKQVYLFHDRGSGFASVMVNGHQETHKIKSADFKRWLRSKFYQVHKKAPNSNAFEEAIETIESKAVFDSSEHTTALRIGQHDGAVYLDLCDESWQQARVKADGWSVIQSKDSPLRFIRRDGMNALPVPMTGGSINDLRRLVNLPDEEHWILTVGWLLGAFRPRGPYAILAVTGEKGSAKSTLCRLLRALIDPNRTPLRRPDKTEHNLFVAASSSWTLCYDNLSGVPLSIADALCTVATGGGLSVRKLYSDDEEVSFDVSRPVMINGIDDLGSRSDLLDRMVTLVLPPLKRYVDEDEVNAEFERVRPGVLGALLDAVSAAIANQGSRPLANPPRMADFANWVTAGEEAFGWKPGTFARIYRANRQDANALAIESSSIGLALERFMDDAVEPWKGTATELREELVSYASNNSRTWPSTPKGLANALRRVAPNLRERGYFIDFPQERTGKDKKRILTLQKRQLPSIDPDVVGEPLRPDHVRQAHISGLAVHPSDETSDSRQKGTSERQ